jgi:antitoxin (DNA-binding transcriptional repressor) of toxin-antitoxin stability system
MKTANIRELRQHFPRVLAWLDSGEEVAITRRRKVIAHLVRKSDTENRKIEIPDFESVQKRIFKNAVSTTNPVDDERAGSLW